MRNRTHPNDDPAAEGERAAKLDNRFAAAIKKINLWNWAMVSTPYWTEDRNEMIRRLEEVADSLGGDAVCLRCSHTNRTTEVKVVDGITRVVQTRVRCAC